MVFNSETAISLARLLVSIALSIFTFIGWSIDYDLLFNMVLTVLTLALFIYTWWKNNNITKAAQEAQLVLNQIKRAEADATIVELKADEVAKAIMEYGMKQNSENCKTK